MKPSQRGNLDDHAYTNKPHMACRRHHSLTENVETILSVTEEDIADYTESVVPQEKRRSNFRMLAQFLSMQAVFGTVLVGYGARFQGLTLVGARSWRC